MIEYSGEGAGTVAATQIAAGRSHSLAILEDGSVWSWGDNSKGQCSFWWDGPNPGKALTPEQSYYWTWVPDTYYGKRWENVSINAVAIAAGDEHSMVLTPDGTVFICGSNSHFQLGLGIDSVSYQQYSFVVVDLPFRITAIAAGNEFSLALDETGQVLGWGDNSDGQLGNGTGQSSSKPVQVVGIGEASDPVPCVVPLSVIVVGEGRVWSHFGGGISSGGIDCGFSCSESFTLDTEISLSAEPADGWSFDRWAGAVEGTFTTTNVLIDGSNICIAYFSRKPIPPVARFTFSHNSPLTTDRIVFDASTSTDNGTIILYQWDFNNDGTFDAVMSNATASTSFTASFVKQFWSAGTYTVGLRVTDDDGLTDETTGDVTVGRAEPPEHDLGDAPDSSNTISGMPMLALSQDVSQNPAGTK